MPTAIVTGATGILGRGITFALGEHPSEWDTVYALSRSKKETYPSNVQHRTVDLLGSAQAIAQQLQGMNVDYVFFTAYMERESEELQAETNGAMLKNFLEALQISGADKNLKRVILACGTKHYGAHFGPTKTPMEEDDARVDEPGRPVNFYYTQQDILRDLSAGRSWDWVVTLPCHVIGLAKGNFMNITLPLGLYAAVNRELGKPLLFPGSQTLYTLFDCFSSSELHAEFCLWAASTPAASNQLFNVVNGDVQSWQNLWPKISSRFAVPIPSNQFTVQAPFPFRVPLAEKPPLGNYADKAGLVGIHDAEEQSFVDARVDLVKWSQDSEVKAAWERLATREGLNKDVWDQATWRFTTFILGRQFSIVQNMTKARKLGWTGYVDTWESISKTFDLLEQERLLPKST